MVDNTNFEQSQKLAPDAEITLFEMVTRGGASVFFKSGPEQFYLGDLYESIPCGISAEKKSADSTPERPNLTIGGDDLDLSVLKPALFSGELDGGTLLKHVVELDDLVNNVNNKITTKYRIKQIKDYTRYQINILLARFTPASTTTIPYVKYLRPAYPHVQL